jgi:hypothetical protein
MKTRPKLMNPLPLLRSPNLRSPNLRSPNLRSPNLRSPNLRSPNLRSPKLTLKLKQFPRSTKKKKLKRRRRKRRKRRKRSLRSRLNLRQNHPEVGVESAEPIEPDALEVAGVLKNVKLYQFTCYMFTNTYF